MSPAPILNNNAQQHPEIKNLSIEIEPSYPLLVAITEFFRAQKKPKQSLELCRLGLNYFPGDMGLRLGLALSYLDLTEKDKAWMEIKPVVLELNQLAPIVDSISKHFRQNEQTKLSEWLHQLSQVLSKYPEEDPENKADSPGDPPAPSLFPEKEFQPEADSQILENSPQEVLPDSNLLSTLTGWLSQLKESKEVY